MACGLGSTAVATAAVAAPHAARTAARDAGMRPAVTTVTWHGISLKNGWVTGQTSSFKTGNPAYASSGGVVYLTGSVKQQPGKTNPTFARLPLGYRPSHELYITIYTGSDTAPGTLRVDPDGSLNAFGANARTFTSLAAISFPVSGLTWKNLPLHNHWASSQARWNSGTPAYAVKGGIVYLSGSMHRTAGSSHLFAWLPTTLRPAHALYLTVYDYVGTVGEIAIFPTGEMDAFGSLAADFVSLAGIKYPSRLIAMHRLTMASGWKSSQVPYNTGDPSYAVVGPIVYLSGSAHMAGATTALAAMLPPAARPAHVLDLQVYTFQDTFGSVGLIPSPSGWVFAVSTPPGNSETFTSFAGIAYPHSA